MEDIKRSKSSVSMKAIWFIVLLILLVLLFILFYMMGSDIIKSFIENM